MRVSISSLVFFAAIILFQLSAVAAARAADLPAISGMALIEGGSFLVVIDTKSGQNKPAVGVYSFSEDTGESFTPIEVVWPDRPANDLESIYGMQTRPGEFLLCESGSWTDRQSGELHQGRVFHSRLEGSPGSWSLSILKAIPMPETLHEVEGMVQYSRQRESVYDDPYSLGAATGWLSDTQIPAQESGAALSEFERQEIENFETARAMQSVIVFGTRGGGYPYDPAELHRYEIDLEGGVILPEPLQAPQLISPSSSLGSPWARGITDLYLDPNGVLWISSAVDTGDFGPFDSYVFMFGSFTSSESDYLAGFYYGSPDVGWKISGLKIEAIGAPFIDRTVLSFATDDEAFGGIVRPLGPGNETGRWY